MTDTRIKTGGRWWLTGYNSGRWWVGAFALWTAFGLLMVGYVQVRFGGSLVGHLPSIVPFYWAWVPMMPLILGRTMQFDFRSGSRLRSLAGHAVGALAVLVAHSCIYSGYRWLVPLGEPAGWTRVLLRTLGRHAAGDVATYAVVTGTMLAVVQHLRAREREREAIRATLHASRLEAQLSAARLEALQMQLRPHFLFNTLNSISVLILKEANPLAIQAIRQLGDLLRATLQTEAAAERPLEEEVDLVERYLAIEKLRFGDRLRVDLQIEAQVTTALVPHLILQPLVENAVVHGLGASRRPVVIRVAARRDSDSLWLEVRDDGAGVPAGSGSLRPGVGLTNTRARLRELYGEDARLSVVAGVGGGTVAAIRLPYRAEPVLAPTEGMA
jgi:two-component system LytT family sensor kinase